MMTGTKLSGLPLRGVVAIAIRAGLRVVPLYTFWSSSQSDIQKLDQTFEVAGRVLQGHLNSSALFEGAETAYRLAAVAAGDYRKCPTMGSERAAFAGMVMHSAIDAVADLESDPRGALTNAVLALQSTAKLGDSLIDEAIRLDLARLQDSPTSIDVENDSEPFGPLWTGSCPVWFERPADGTRNPTLVP